MSKICVNGEYRKMTAEEQDAYDKDCESSISDASVQEDG